MDRDLVRDSIPAYALGALNADERAQVEALLREDDSARLLLREAEAAASALALAVPALTPPAGLEERLLARARQSRRSLLLTRWMAAAAVLALTVLVLFGWAALRQNPEPKALYDLVMADDGHVEIALVPALTPDIEGRLVFRPSDNLAVIEVSNLPPIASDQAFQLWLVDESGPVSGGLFRVNDDTDYVMVSAARPIAEYLRFGVSLEPATGSPLGNRASGPRVFSIPIQPV
ncbi:MAG: anti-sigma factor [Anaerolineae bacterium]|nr:anti-sigma factor [Anaerolineae bacterium]